jgi:catechol 2,3-dioxygenase-like lactoylglutathione lyase family enzyme
MKWAAGLLVLAGTPAAGQTVGPWTEAVVSVRDPDGASRLFREAASWRVTGRGKLSRAELDYWRLPASASGRFLRICAPAAETGCLRFVRFGGVAQRPVRLAARAWDTGGIFSVMVRSDNARALFDRAIAMGWWAESEPVAFSFGSSSLVNVVLQGPDGFNLAVYERRSPPFTAFPLGAISQGFNSMRMVRDQRAAVRFYREGLGFEPVFDSDYRDPAPGPNNFSLPWNLTTSVVRRASALQPQAGETGRVEVMEFQGLKGRDFSAGARAPNLGVLSVRYPVQGLAAYRRRLAERGVTEAQAAARVPLPGLGTADLVAVADPDGALTEFYEVGR